MPPKNKQEERGKDTMPIQIQQLIRIFFLGILFLCGHSCTTSPFDSQSDQPQLEPGEQRSGRLATNNNDTIEASREPNHGSHNQSAMKMNALEPGEVCVINKDEAEAKRLNEFTQARGYISKKRRVLKELGFVMSIVKVPTGQTVQQGIADLRQQFPSYIIDANHHYSLQEPTAHIDPFRYGHQLVKWHKEAVSCRTKNLRIGIIDTSVNLDQAPLQHQTIHTQSFLSSSTPKAPNNHGTAVATLLIGQTLSKNHGLLPNASLFVAEAFRQKDLGHVEATTWSIVRSLDWLVKQKPHIINLSLGGPENSLLTYAITQTLNRNIPIVAAAGNTGPDGHSMYPAAQDGVIAVTALDVSLRPYRYASQGSYIAFSAPGVDIWIPHGDGKGIFKSGTSFATPFVTAAAAAIKQSNPHWKTDQISRQLADSAVDLGNPGKDITFGWGLIQIPQTCPKAHPSIHKQSS